MKAADTAREDAALQVSLPLVHSRLLVKAL
jgi:hypothetical protein